MKKTIAMLFAVSSISSGAEDFNWSWEKDGNTPVEQPRQESAAKPDPAMPADIVGGPLVDVPAAKDAEAGVAVKSAATDDNFSWGWEKDAEKTAGGQGTKPKAGVAAQGSPQANIESETLPAEIENLSGGAPRIDAANKETVELPVRRPNPPSAPLVVPRAAEVPAQFPDVSNEPALSNVSGAAVAGSAAPAPGTTGRTGGVDARAYDELIRENLELHKKLEDGKHDKDVIKQENQRLAREVKDLEQKITESIGRIKDLGKQKDSSAASPVQQKTLEDRLKKAEEEKANLSLQLAAMQTKLAGQSKVQPVRPDESIAARPAEAIKPGSDLYQKLESENIALRQKLAEIEADRQKAVRAKEDTEKREKLSSEDAVRALEAQKQMKGKLEEAKTIEKKQKKILVDLAERIPDMEKEMTGLQKKLSEKDTELKEKARNLEVLANEIQQRENRIRKAQKMVELMEQAQRDVGQVSDNEKRDMHYNMAAVYSQTGRFLDAEREYLHALRLDPTDADVHYNLGILYDESLKEKQKAAMHYRRYLKLRPSGPDVDAVKSWLLNIDMKK